MDNYSSEQMQATQDFWQFYVDLIENHVNTLSYYLDDTAVLDWFGQTVKGTKNIVNFLRHKMRDKIKHVFPNIEPCLNIGYRDTHVIKNPPRKQIEYSCTISKSDIDEEKTPPNPPKMPPTNVLRGQEVGQGDGVHNSPDSPMKKRRLEKSSPSSTDSGDVEKEKVEEEPSSTPTEIIKLTSDGHLEFRGSSSKKLQKETKWLRPCKFQTAFSNGPTGYVIHLIIYQGNMRCRRNLMRDFEAE